VCVHHVVTEWVCSAPICYQHTTQLRCDGLETLSISSFWVGECVSADHCVFVCVFVRVCASTMLLPNGFVARRYATDTRCNSVQRSRDPVECV
jgi:hypothetical protein